MRRATSAGRPSPAEASFTRSSFLNESTTMARMPAVTACSISARLLATPLKTICSPAKPACSAFHSSPPEFTSAFMPAFLTCSSTHRLPHALLAKKTSVFACRLWNASRSVARFSAMREALNTKNGVGRRSASSTRSTSSNVR